jgi:hypothetical protein
VGAEFEWRFGDFEEKARVTGWRGDFTRECSMGLFSCQEVLCRTHSNGGRGEEDLPQSSQRTQRGKSGLFELADFGLFGRWGWG